MWSIFLMYKLFTKFTQNSFVWEIFVDYQDALQNYRRTVFRIAWCILGEKISTFLMRKKRFYATEVMIHHASC